MAVSKLLILLAFRSAGQYLGSAFRKGTTKRLTAPLLRAYLRSPPDAAMTLPDGAIPGLSVRLGTGGTANWSFFIRVAGEGGVRANGKQLLGPKHRVNLGRYPQVSIAEARAKAASLLERAKKGP